MGGNNKSQQQGKDCVQGSISLRSVEWNCLGQGIETYRTGSGEYALYIITKGRGSITAGGIEYEAAEGNVLAVFPETDVKEVTAILRPLPKIRCFILSGLECLTLTSG